MMKRAERRTGYGRAGVSRTAWFLCFMLAAVLWTGTCLAAVSGSLKATTVKPGSSGYILPNSDAKYLKEADLEDLSSAELRVARNEIYARRGRKFKDKDLQDYFDARSWYRGRFAPEKFDEADMLNKYEKANVSLIKQCEAAKAKEVDLSEYVMPDSDSRYLTESDLTGLSARSLRIARNEIYARRGRMFKDADLQAYFDSCSWYDGRIKPEKFDSGVFNKYESKNVSFIRKWEKSLGTKGKNLTPVSSINTRARMSPSSANGKNLWERRRPRRIISCRTATRNT